MEAIKYGAMLAERLIRYTILPSLMKKRIAYAPSIGYNQTPTKIIDIFKKKYVNEIIFLSVREKHGAVLIKEATGRDAHVVLDPSLLLTKEQWEKEIQQA